MSNETTTPALRYPRRQVVRFALRAGIAAALSVLCDLKIEGAENLPKRGPMLIVSNHFNFLDPVLMIRLVPAPMEFIGGLRTPNAPAWTETFRRAWGVLHVRRGGSSYETIKTAQSTLEQNGLVCLFPEGGSWAAVLRPARPGVALLTARAGAPILPVGLDGVEQIFPIRFGKRPRVTIRVGKPFGPFRFETRDRSSRQLLDEAGHEIMHQIAALLPPERRGFYSDDPAIREAARGSEIYPWETVIEE